jgi:glycosyltransferase involved in cell wall biosynthesis
MKIWLFITNLQGGGAERSVINIASALADRGHVVRIVMLEDRVDYPVPPGISLCRIGRANRQISKGWIGKRVAAWRLRRWASEQSADARPDLVISTLPFADEVVSASGLANVWYRISNTMSAEIAALAKIYPDKAKRRLARYRRLYDNQNIIAVSEGVAADLRDRLDIREAKIVSIYNPFDFAEIRRLAAAPEPALPAEPYIIHAGRFAAQKRHDVLLDSFAAANLPHRLVLLTKRSVPLGRLIAAKGLSGRVIIAGFQTNPYPWYASASALVLSSDFEGFPNVLVEALACGTPVVSTDCPSGPSEILTGSLSRYLSPCGDVMALARNLVSAVEAPPRVEPEILVRFSRETVLGAIEGLAMRPPDSK